jgi:hypothetical protein
MRLGDVIKEFKFKSTYFCTIYNKNTSEKKLSIRTLSKMELNEEYMMIEAE